VSATNAVELDRLAVFDDPARKRARPRPLVAEHRTPLRLFFRVVRADHRVDVARGDQRDLAPGGELDALELGAERARVGDGQHAVDRHHAVFGLDEVRIDENSRGAGGVGVDRRRRSVRVPAGGDQCEERSEREDVLHEERVATAAGAFQRMMRMRGIDGAHCVSSTHRHRVRDMSLRRRQVTV
jgi:hypothetical protein